MDAMKKHQLRKTKMMPPDEALSVLLKKHPALQAKLIEALETDRFFVTLSCQKKKTPADPNDLKHFWIQQKYPPNDVLLSLRHIANDYKAKECPTAEIEGNGWV